MESFENHKLPVLRDRDATDPARIVRWAKEALTCGQAHPKVFEKYNLLRFCVSEEVRAMWAALTEDVEGAPEDDYPEDIDIDSTDTEQLAKKRDWHVAWLQAVISYYSTSQQDSVYDAIRQHVAWTGSKDKPTRNAIAEWALSCARAEKAVAPEAWSDADPKALFAACARVLPEAIRTLLQQNKPEGGQRTWKTAAKFLNQRTRACEADDAFRIAVGFVGPESGPGVSTIQILRMGSNGSNSGTEEAPRVLVSAGVGVASGTTSKRLPTRRRSLMPAKAKGARKANLARLVARRAASLAASASVTEKAMWIQSLPRRRRIP